MHDGPTAANTQLTDSRASTERSGRGFVQAYNSRDLDAMLALAHPEIVGKPSSALGGGTFNGHDGLRNWWSSLTERRLWYQLEISGVDHIERRTDDRRIRQVRAARYAADLFEQRAKVRRQIPATKLALFGEVRLGAESLAPWSAVLIVQDELILRVCAYLSTRELLEQMGIVRFAVAADV